MLKLALQIASYFSTNFVKFHARLYYYEIQTRTCYNTMQLQCSKYFKQNRKKYKTNNPHRHLITNKTCLSKTYLYTLSGQKIGVNLIKSPNLPDLLMPYPGLFHVKVPNLNWTIKSSGHSMKKITEKNRGIWEKCKVYIKFYEILLISEKRWNSCITTFAKTSARSHLNDNWPGIFQKRSAPSKHTSWKFTSPIISGGEIHTQIITLQNVHATIF